VLLIPFAVYRGLTDSKRDLPPAIDLASMPWLIVAAAADQNRVQELWENPDPGEAEAIVLATELRADLLLVDERRGRRPGVRSTARAAPPPISDGGFLAAETERLSLAK
jgi:predicted nucleic acid-binding protein